MPRLEGIPLEGIQRCERFSVEVSAIVSAVDCVLTAEAELACDGPSPSLMMARESGINFVCQPLSAWNFCIADSVAESQWPLGSVM